MIPAPGGALLGPGIQTASPWEQPSRTYRIDFEAGRVGGFTHGREAMEQAIYKILNTERFTYLIYSWNYGVELNAVMGKSHPAARSELKRVIREALLADGRITDINSFTIEGQGKRGALVSFTAETIFGEIPVEKAVETHV